MSPLRCHITGHPSQQMLPYYYKYAQGVSEPGESIPISHWKLYLLKCLAWQLSHFTFQFVIFLAHD